MVQRNIKNTIILLSLALVCLIGVQLYWVQSAYHLRKSEFNKKFAGALEKTAREVENYKTCFELVSKAKINPGQGIYITRQKYDTLTGKWLAGHDTVDLFYLRTRDTSVRQYQNMQFDVPATVEVQLNFQIESIDGVTYWPQPKEYQFSDITGKNFFDKMAGDVSLASKIDTAFLDSVIHKNLAEAHLPGKVYYGIINGKTNKLEYKNQRSNVKKLLASDQKINIFNDKYFTKPYFLTAYYPDSFSIVLGTLWVMLITSGAIIAILIYAFWYFVRAMLRQKKLSAMKTDFINNMTHEFKTPVTNIALALETIGDDPHKLNGQLNYILNIIGEENNRLRENVERILQIAAVEKEDLNLRIEKVDIHCIVVKVIKAFEIQTERLKGRIQYSFTADNSVIHADENHLINVIYNLIDNALKYSAKNPEILVKTENTKTGIVITVKDNGIGMTQVTQKKIFEKFYRAQQGNVHDVKGFGLGLSYVKSIVDAHKGTIQVKSEAGAGSSFSIFIPFNFSMKYEYAT